MSTRPDDLQTGAREAPALPRKRRRRPPAPISSQVPGAAAGRREAFAGTEEGERFKGFVSRVERVDRQANGTLPIGVTVALANSDLGEQGIARASALLAQTFDVEPAWLFEGQRNDQVLTYIDPISGRELSLDTARRIIRPHEPEVIAALLKNFSGAPTATSQDPERGRAEPIRPRQVARFMLALAPLPGESITFSNALGAAVRLAQQGVNPDLFQANLEQFAPLNIAPLTAVAMAEQTAARNIRVRDQIQARTLVLPPEAQYAIEQAENRTASREQIKQLSDIDAEVERRIGAMSPEQVKAAEFGGDTIENIVRRQVVSELEGAEVMAMGGFGAFVEQGQELLDAARTGEQDIIALGEQLTKEVRDYRAAYKNSTVGKVFSGVLTTLDYTWRPFAAALRVTGEGVESAARLIVPGGSRDRLKAEVEEAWDDAGDIMGGRTTLGHAISKDYGLPTWVGATIEFGLGWVVDPLLVVGRAGRAFRINRTMWGATAKHGPDAWMDMADATIHAPRALLGKRNLVQYLGDTLEQADNASDFLKGINVFRRGVYGQRGILNNHIAGQLYAFGKSSLKAGRSRQFLDEQVEYLLAYSMGAKVPESAFARVADLEYQRAVRLQESVFTDPLRGVESKAVAADIAETERLASQLNDWHQQATSGMLLRSAAEIPRVWLPKIAARNLGEGFGVMGDALATGPWGRWIKQRGVHTRQNIQALFNHRPQGQIRWHSPDVDPVADFRKQMVSDRAWSDVEIGKWQTEWSKRIGNVTSPTYEADAVEFLTRYSNAKDARIAKEYGFTLDEARSIYGDAAGGEARQTFGVRPALSPEELDRYGIPPDQAELITRPVPGLETQLVNRFQITDSVAMRNALTNAQGAARRLETAAFKLMGLTRPASRQVRRQVMGTFRDLSKGLARDYLRFWKPWVVARPAYILRVPVLDEGIMRFTATMGMAPRLRATKSGAKAISTYRRMRGVDDPLVDEVIQVGAKGRVVTGYDQGRPIYGDLQESELSFLLPGARDDVDNVLELASAGGYRALTRVGGETVVGQVASRTNLYRKGTGGWAEIDPRAIRGSKEMEEYADWWDDVLRNQYGRSEIGEPILRRIAGGVNDEARLVDEITAELLAGDRRALSRVLGRDATPERVRMHVEGEVREVMYLTGAVANHSDAALIASNALQGVAQPSAVLAMPKNVRPVINGPASSRATGVASPFMRGASKAADWILAKPTNVLNRHPFAREWNQRTEKALLKVLDQQGVDVTNAAVRSAVKDEAAGFAADQVRQVLFDFRDQGRIGEMLSFFMPFVQPFGEVFVSYGRVIRRNPAFLGYAYFAGRALEESGYVRRDENTGELVVPMPNIVAALSFLPFVDQIPGLAFSSPLEGFNMFVSTTFNVGGVPIPTPSLSPPALFALWAAIGDPDQDFVSPEVRSKVLAWAFEFGPPEFPEDFLPTWTNNLISAGFPSWQEDRVSRYTADFLRMQELQGVPILANEIRDGEVVAAVPPPEGFTREEWNAMTPEARQSQWQKHREEMARRTAQSYFFSLAVSSATYPSRVQPTMPTDELEREWRLVMDAYGAEGARAEWFKRHPETFGIAIGKTTMGPDVESPVPIPATPAVDIILSQPYARSMAKRTPRWLWAIIPSELRETEEFNPGSFSTLLATGQLKTLAPDEWLKKEQVGLGWQAYFPRYEQWLAKQDHLDRKDISESDPRWISAHLAFEEDVNQMKLMYPEWADEHGEFDLQAMDANVIKEAELLLEDPTFMKTDVGQGLKEYWDLTRGKDGLRSKMQKVGTTSLDTKWAEQSGMLKTYEDGVAAIIERHPDFESAYDLFFRYDLKGEPTALERALGEMDPDQERDFIKEATEWQEFDYKRISRLTGFDQDEAWVERRQWIEDYMASHTDPKTNIILLEWESKSPYEKTDYLSSLSARPYIYWTRFERETVLGQKTNNEAEAAWTSLAATRVEISRLSDQGKPVADLYDSLDNQLLGYMKKNPVLAQQVYDSNDWGFKFEATSPLVRKNLNPGAYDFWQAWVGAIRTVQSAADKAKINFVEDDEFWRAMDDGLKEYAELLKEENSAFAAQWTKLEEENGTDDLIYTFIPDRTGPYPYYFPLGGWEGRQQNIPGEKLGLARLQAQGVIPEAKPDRRVKLVATADDPELGKVLAEEQKVAAPDAAKGYARKLAAEEYGWTDKEWDALDELWQRTSGWEWSAKAGVKRGIPGLPMTSFGPDWKRDSNRAAQRYVKQPRFQIRYGLEWIKQKHGTPSAALAGYHGGNLPGETGY